VEAVRRARASAVWKGKRIIATNNVVDGLSSHYFIQDYRYTYAIPDADMDNQCCYAAYAGT
jgi:hypothetical protein